MDSQPLAQYLAVIRKWWWLLVACVLVASISSYIGTRGMPRIYQATTTVMVGQSLQKLNPSDADFYISQQLAQTYVQMVRRRPILQKAAQALGLQFIPSPAAVSARQVPGTQLMEIAVRDTDPARARALADEIAHQLILATPSAGETEDRRAFVQQQLADLETKIKGTNDEIEAEEQKLQSANSARTIQQTQANVEALQRKLASYQTTYSSLLVTVQGATNQISVVEPATTPIWPIRPNVKQIVILAAAIGLGLSVFGAFLIELLDDTVRSAEEVTRLTGLPLLGTIARMSGADYDGKLITHLDPLSPITEAYRVLRTNVEFSVIDKPLYTLMVTSAGPSEGKSVTLANLAVTFAESGRRVLLVDTDLRRPAQHRLFGLSNAAGLSDAIRNPRSNIMAYVRKTGVENLWLLTAGQIPPNPAELLSSARLGRILEDLRQHADLVLFDSPPSLVVTDSRILGSRVDAVLLVTDLGQTRRYMAKQMAQELARARANLIGVLLNRVTASGGGYYHLYQYYHYDNADEKRQAKRKRRVPRWLSPRRHADSPVVAGVHAEKAELTAPVDMALSRKGKAGSE